MEVCPMRKKTFLGMLIFLILFVPLLMAQTISHQPYGISTPKWYGYSSGAPASYYLAAPTLSANDTACGIAATQTLTNKTLTAPTLTTPIIASLYQDAAKTKLMTVPDTASDTLSAIAATQTLTNKTLTTPIIASLYQDAGKTKLMTLPDTASDTLVTLAAEQTLTTKTLTTPIIASLYQDAGKTQLMTLPNTASDTLVALAAEQTLTTKTLTTPIIASLYQDAGKTKLMTVPDTASDTLVALAAEQTLTTKTLTSPTVNGGVHTGITLNNSASGKVQIPEGTPVNAVAAVGTLTIGAQPTLEQTFVVATQTFTWKESRSQAGEVTQGADAPAAVANAVTAINADLAGVVLASDGEGDTVVVTAVTKGTSGNAIIFTEACDNITIDGEGTLGGTTPGVDGTVGSANEVLSDGSYLYLAIAANTVADNNWRRVALGSAY